MADIRITPAASVMAFTSSLNYKETLTQDASGSVVLAGSGSTGRSTLFAIDGNNGRLFSVDDDLSDSIFSANTVAGLPVIEAFADNSVNLGKYGAESIVISGSNGSIQLSGSIKVPTLPSTSDTVVVTYNTTTKTLGYNTVAGPSGISGLSGASGRSGLSGISGLSGASGISGLSGASGRSGLSGTSGISGISGASGISGLSGRSGISGTNGTNGTSFTWQGTWDPGISYVINDVVYHNGSSYIAIKNTIGSDPASNPADWQLMALSGISGTSGTNGLSGISGLSGTNGISGLSGRSGISGLSGTSGISGLSGASAGITSYTNPADNRVLTSVSSTTINAEANLTYDGTNLVNTISDGYIRATKDNDEYVWLRSLGVIYMSRGTSQLSLDAGFGGINQKSRIFTTNIGLDITTTGGSLDLSSNGGSSAMGVTATSLNCTGDVVAYASDERLKTNFQPINNALDKVNSLRAITYEQNKTADQYLPPRPYRQVGVIAQDIQKVLPEAVKPAPFDTKLDKNGNIVSKTGENYLTVQYEKLVPLLIASIQELTNKVNSLEKQLNNK